MAYDKIVDSAALEAGLTLVAEAIRTKAGIADKLLFPDGYTAAVEGIQTGGGGSHRNVIKQLDFSGMTAGAVVT